MKPPPARADDIADIMDAAVPNVFPGKDAMAMEPIVITLRRIKFVSADTACSD
jgi:hypothetical protein